MVVIHDVLVPLRFLALMGHFLAALLALYAVVRLFDFLPSHVC